MRESIGKRIEYFDWRGESTTVMRELTIERIERERRTPIC